MTSASATAVSGTGIVAPRVREFGPLERALGAWLATRLPGARNLRLGNFAYPRGAGLSHETILFDARWEEDGRSIERGLVVRIKPLGHNVYVDDLFEEQFRLMTAMHAHGSVPVAAPLWFEPEAAVLGAPFFVMAKLHGRVAVNYPPYAREGWLADLAPAQRRRLWRSGVTALAGVQRLPLSEADFLDPAGRFADGFEQEWDRWRRYAAWVTADGDFPFLDGIWRLLEANRPSARVPGLVWGDARIGNLMFDDEQKVVAVLDWEQPSRGGALHDLGWWLFTARLETVQQGLAIPSGMGDRAETIALWQETTGLDVSDIDWYERFAGFKLACLSIRTLRLRGIEQAGMNAVDNPPTRALADMFGIPRPTA